MPDNLDAAVPKRLEPGVFDIPLRLPQSLAERRGEFRELIFAAQRRLLAFAARHGWERHMDEPFAREACVFADKPSFDKALLALCEVDPRTELPPMYCGALERGALVCVSPEVYRAVYPEGDEDDAFEKLLTHEMAHRLHIRILAGDEEAMGPVWFYEGFALHAAEQLTRVAPKLREDEIWAVVAIPERQDYRNYVSVLQYFLGCVSVEAMVAKAGKPDYADWLRGVCGGTEA